MSTSKLGAHLKWVFRNLESATRHLIWPRWERKTLVRKFPKVSCSALVLQLVDWARKLSLWERPWPASAPPLIVFGEVLRTEKTGLGGWVGVGHLGAGPLVSCQGTRPRGRPWEGKGWCLLLAVGVSLPRLDLFLTPRPSIWSWPRHCLGNELHSSPGPPNGWWPQPSHPLPGCHLPVCTAVAWTGLQISGFLNDHSQVAKWVSQNQFYSYIYYHFLVHFL